MDDSHNNDQQPEWLLPPVEHEAGRIVQSDNPVFAEAMMRLALSWALGGCFDPASEIIDKGQDHIERVMEYVGFNAEGGRWDGQRIKALLSVLRPARLLNFALSGWSSDNI